jgi:hypothetical protein
MCSLVAAGVVPASVTLGRAPAEVDERSAAPRTQAPDDLGQILASAVSPLGLARAPTSQPRDRPLSV